MRMMSNISVTTNQNCILTVQSDAGPVTSLTYTHANRSILFGTRELTVQTKEDILTYLDNFSNYNSTILNNFQGLNPGLDIPWGKIEWRMEYKPQQNRLEFQFSKDNKTLLELQGDYKQKNITVLARKQEVTLTYPEWEAYLRLFKFYVHRLPF